MENEFRNFLSRVHIDNVDEEIQYIEVDLKDFFVRHVNQNISSIYEISDVALCKGIRAKMQTEPEYKAENIASGNNRLSQALKLYIGFLESPYYPHPDKNSRQSSKPAQAPLPKEAVFSEGAKKHVEQERSQRNPKLRQLCIAHYGFTCQICGFNFEKAYGEIGKDFIEVHHLNPISNYRDEHSVDPIKDLVPLCSNCHSMIHHGANGVMTLKELREQYKGMKWEIPVRMED